MIKDILYALYMLFEAVFIGGCDRSPKRGWDINKPRKKLVPMFEGGVRYFLKKRGFELFSKKAIYQTLASKNLSP